MKTLTKYILISILFLLISSVCFGQSDSKGFSKVESRWWQPGWLPDYDNPWPPPDYDNPWPPPDFSWPDFGSPWPPPPGASPPPGTVPIDQGVFFVAVLALGYGIRKKTRINKSTETIKLLV